MKTIKLIPMLAVFLLAMTMTFAFSVSGTVRNSGDLNPLTNPIFNAYIDVINTIGGTPANWTNSSAAGTYISDVGTGLKTFTVSASGFNPQIVTTFVSADMSNFDFSLGPIKSYILKGNETNSQSGVNVQLKQSGATIYQTATDATGAYSLNALNGTYTFQATKSGFSTYTSTVTINGADVNKNFTLSVSVTTATINGYVRNSTGSVLSGALVRLTRAGGTINENTTDGTGFYSIGTNAGIYNATASLAGFNDQTFSVVLSAGATTSRNFSFTPIGTVAPPPPPPPPSSPGGSSGGSGGSSGIIITGPSTIGPQTFFWDITKDPILTRTIRPIDSLIFDYQGTSYNLIVDKFRADSFTFKISPTSERRSGIKADTYDFTIKDRILMLSIEDIQFNAVNEGQSLMKLKLTLKDGMTQSLSAPEPKFKNGIIKIVGEIIPPKDASVPVGIGISVATLIVGLMLFLGLRLIWG